MRRIVALVIVVTALVACQDTSTRHAAAAPGAQRVAPEGYVVTPHGLVHRSCVRLIAPGESVSAQGVVLHANGEREQLARCQYPRLDLHTFKPIVPGPKVAPTINGWVEASNWNAPSALGVLSANFPVPSAPTSNGATIFFFPGSEPGDGSTILQPVLQYGSSAGGGGNYWAAASWFCCPAGWSNYSPLINVNVGDTILGTMTATCSGSSCNWSIVTSDTTSGTSTTLSAANVTSPFTWDFGGVLESYSVGDCSQYPAAGTIAFTNIALQDQSGNAMQPSWSSWVIGGTPSCGYAVQSTPSTATLSY
jgi:hypothetical protein